MSLYKGASTGSTTQLLRSTIVSTSTTLCTASSVMKIGPKLSSSRRKFNKDHRSSRKAKNAAHDAKVKLWRTRRKLLTHMKATSIRKYGSSAKVYPRRDGKQPKYMRLRRKNVPLPFSPLWTRNSPPTQYSYKR